MTDEVPATGLLLHGIMHPLRTRKEIADAVMPYPAQIGRLPVLVKMFLPNSTGGHRCSQQALIDGCNDRTPGIGSNSRTRSEEHTSELQSLMRISYPIFCLKKKT